MGPHCWIYTIAVTQVNRIRFGPQTEVSNRHKTSYSLIIVPFNSEEATVSPEALTVVLNVNHWVVLPVLTHVHVR